MRPLDDYSFIKGFNYEYDRYGHDVMERDFTYAQRLTLNSCRPFFHMSRWREDREGFLAEIRDLVRTAWSKGISTTPILMMPYFADGQKPYWSAPAHSNAPIPGCYDPANWAIGDAYVADVVNALKDEPGLLFWDAYNEPGWHGFLQSVDDPVERARRFDLVWAHVRHVIGVIRENDPVNAIGVGHVRVEDNELSGTAELADIIVYHDYLQSSRLVEESCRKAVEMGRRYGKPVINNETGCICRANPYELEIRLCNQYRIGYYLFELMIPEETNQWSRVHGIVYPDGTVRDPSIVAAIQGFFRNRSDSAILPDLNQEHEVDRTLAIVRERLEASARTDREHQEATADDLLDAAERCANLLEAGEMVPMYYPPTRRIEELRRAPHKDLMKIRNFTYELARQLQDKGLVL
ncbi:hypothetical protein JS533_010835 [Bifidobacterium amazonense]|uniref:Glycoside hydrolase family 5 domain-containing protein n=1 Tax=Bifidobacterium amazonense TaxID=2809027 RepID=A0ABS9VXX2_9BIFI|nr:hypothetical protein [Bifidobacterium amazonense]MCH9276761.1 hypothetical protein [Bifidobacterium amazonense]